MYGFNGIALPNALLARLGDASKAFIQLGGTSYIGGGSQFVFTYLWVTVLLFITLLMPNTQQVMKNYLHSKIEQGNALFDKGVLPNRIVFRYSIIWAFIMAGVLVIAIFGLTRVSEFLYFQF